jgi:hypothetical protein
VARRAIEGRRFPDQFLDLTEAAMAKASEIQNPELREKMESAFAAMRAGKGGEAVHTLADAFVRFLDIYPAVRGETVGVRTGQMARIMRWPNLGANIVPGSARAGKIEITFTRERFSSAEALTYYQFVLDEILAAENRQKQD